MTSAELARPPRHEHEPDPTRPRVAPAAEPGLEPLRTVPVPGLIFGRPPGRCAE
jgi:hypothetical protein